MLVVAFPHHDARMIPASARLHAAIVEQRLTLPENPELRPPRLRRDRPSLATRVARGQAEPAANVDAIIALAMGVERAEEKLEPVQLLGWL